MTTPRADALRTLYEDVLHRLDLAHERIHTVNASDELKAALRSRLERLTERATFDLTHASRRLDTLLEEMASEG